MSDKLEVVITGRDGVSRIFKEVTTSAAKTGQAVENMGKKGERSLTELREKSVAVGAAFGALVSISSVLGQSYHNQQLRIRGLETSYGAASDELIEFSEHLQDNSNFSNDAAQAALLSASTITREYGIAVDQIDDLVQRSADLAAVFGKDVTDATERVTAAVRGEAEAAESLGIAMSDSVLQQEAARMGLVGWNTTMTEAEKAQVRFAVLMEQTAYAEGKAAAAAEGHAGKARHVVNELQDVAQAAGGAIGPIGAYSAILGDMALLAPAAGALAGKVISGLGAAGGLVGALGPVGVTAVAAAAGIAFLSTTLRDYNDILDQSATLTENQNEIYLRLLANLGPARAMIATEINNLTTVSREDAEKRQRDLDALEVALADMKQTTGGDLSQTLAFGADVFSDFTEAQKEWIDFNKDGAISLEELSNAVDMFKNSADRLDAGGAAQLAEDVSAVMLLLANPDIDADRLANRIRELDEQLNSGQITMVEYAANISAIADGYGQFLIISAEVESAINGITMAQIAANNATLGQASTLEANSTLYGNLADAQRAAMVVAGEQHLATLTLSDAYSQTAEIIDAEFTPASDRMSASMDAQIQRAKDIAAAIADYGDALGVLPQMEENSAAGFAARAGQAGAALGDAFRVAVGNTNAIGSQSGQVDEWARSLINVSGQYGKIDDLLARGVINQDDWNSAQAAGTKIFDANARIQDDILEIQTKQAPVIADLHGEQAVYMDQLANLPAAEQAVKLAYMDTAESAKALSAVQLAQAATAGELGAAGVAIATDMITAAAEADPYLRTLLEDMGLISVGTDGTITVNFDSVKDASTSLADVVGAIEHLGELIQEVFKIQIESNAADQRESLQSMVNLLNELNGKSVTYYVSASGSGVTVGNPDGPGISPIAHGGVIPAANGYAGDILVGEFGPELLRRSGGGALVLPTGATQSRMASGGGMGGFTMINNFTGPYDGNAEKMAEEVAKILVPAVKLAFENHYRGYGIR